VEVEGQRLTVQAPAAATRLAAGDAVTLSWPASALNVMEGEEGA
jgi:hypothetical protein